MTLTSCILFCALIASAFSNENAKAHHSFNKLHRTHQLSSSHNYRTPARLSNRNIIPEGLELYLNGTSGLIGFLNTTTNAGAIFDLSSSTVVVLTGQGGSAIVVDGISNSTLKIDNVWSASSTNFEAFFRSLSGLQSITQSGQTVSEQDVEPELSRLANQLGIDSEACKNFAEAAKILHRYEKIIRLLIRQDHFRARGSLLRSVTVLKGIADLFSTRPQDLTSILKGNSLDLPSIINAPNGLQALLRILQSLGRINLTPLVGTPLSSLDKILRIIVELGGNDSDDGVDNTLRIIYNIVALINGDGCLDCLINSLLEAGQNGGLQISGSEITPIIDDILKIGENQSGGGIFNVLLKFLRDLNSNNLFMNDINISRLLLLLRKGDYKGAIDMIVHFFVRFNNILNPAMTIPRFFGYLLSALNSTRGGRFLPQLLPGVDPSQVQQQLQGLNVTSIFKNQTDFSRIPAIGQLYNVFSGSVSRASNGSLNFTDLVRQNPWSLPPPGGIAWNFGRFFGLGFLQPFQSFLDPSQNGGNGISIIGQLVPPQFTNILVNNSAPSSSTTETEPASGIYTTLTDTTTSQNPLQSLFGRKNHHEHARKGSKLHHVHVKHHKHLKHEKKYGEKHHQHS